MILSLTMSVCPSRSLLEYYKIFKTAPKREIRGDFIDFPIKTVQENTIKVSKEMIQHIFLIYTSGWGQLNELKLQYTMVQEWS